MPILHGGRPAGCLGDLSLEPGALIPLPPPDPVIMGVPNILMKFRPVGTLTANQSHGPVTLGVPYPTILLGGRPSWPVGSMDNCPIPNAPPPAGPGTPHLVGILMPPGAI